MNFFVVETHFQKPFEQFGETVAQHRAYLQTWYDKGVLLCSGPQTDMKGGFIIGRAASRAEIDAMISGDPYHLLGLVKYTVKEFTPVKKSAVLDGWK